MSADASHRLALLARRTLSLPTLPPYPTELVLALTSQITSSHRLCDAILSPASNATTGTASSTPLNPASDPATAVLLLVHHINMRRDKRALLAYHRVRADRILSAIWAGVDPMDPGPSTANANAAAQTQTQAQAQALDPAGQSSALSPEEESLYHAYADMLSGYAGKFSDVDLTGSLEAPRDLFVDVRVVREGGEVQTEYGTINLTKNSQFYVRLNDVERLIAQGFLQRLT